MTRIRVNELIDKLDLNVLTDGNHDNSDICGVYICDLLSSVIYNAKKGFLWITVHTNLNIVAVASLVDLPMVVIPESIYVEPTTIKKANEKGVLLCQSALDSFSLAIKINESTENFNL